MAKLSFAPTVLPLKASCPKKKLLKSADGLPMLTLLIMALPMTSSLAVGVSVPIPTLSFISLNATPPSMYFHGLLMVSSFFKKILST